MAKPKGSEKVGGRVAGTPNKATGAAREAIAQFVEGNVDRLNGWLDAIADKDPKQAFDCFMGVVEYHIPKLARTELRNPDGETFRTETTLKDSDREILDRWMASNKTLT